MKEEEMRTIGEMIARILTDTGNATTIKEVKEQVIALASTFPLYPEIA